jgi:hypothetical protein
MSKHYIQKGDIHTFIIKKDNELQMYIGTEVGIKALGDIKVLNKIKNFDINQSNKELNKYK